MRSRRLHSPRVCMKLQRIDRDTPVIFTMAVRETPGLRNWRISSSLPSRRGGPSACYGGSLSELAVRMLTPVRKRIHLWPSDCNPVFLRRVQGKRSGNVHQSDTASCACAVKAGTHRFVVFRPATGIPRDSGSVTAFLAALRAKCTGGWPVKPPTMRQRTSPAFPFPHKFPFPRGK